MTDHSKIHYVTTEMEHGDDIWAHFSLASPTQVTLRITMDAKHFEDVWGSWLGGPWKVSIEKLEKGLNE